MGNEVFANGLELACKAGDGKSVACFPDVCFSPPAPPAGWIPIPYPNTAYARDTTNGSITVFISGKPVMKKDRSYFRTSTGNEAAAGPKGIVTGVKKGKAYFASWSMNVMIEGQNVDRHTDLMTHNHGSMPGNTGVWHFLDTADEKADCKREKERVEKACGGMKKERKGRRTKWVDAGKPVAWKGECGALLRKPFNLGAAQGMPDIDSLLGQIKERLGGLADVDRLVSEAMGAVRDRLLAMGAKFAAKQVVKKVPVVGWVWQAWTLKDDIAQGAHMVQVFDAAKAEAERIANQVQNIRGDLKGLRDRIVARDFDGAAAQIADWQRTAATLNQCTRARKCMLVPMDDTTSASGKSLRAREGCCPGQTGHHLIPDAYLKQGQGCSDYKYGKAPVVCAEGVNDYHGSHGAAHTALTSFARKGADGAGNIPYDEAVAAAIRSHTETFPFSLCSVRCLKAQLDNYYKGKAKCSDDAALKFKPMGRPPVSTDDM